MRWRDIWNHPRLFEVAFLFAFLVVAPLYLMVRLRVAFASSEAEAAQGVGPVRANAGAGGEFPFHTDDIDPQGNLQVKVPETVKIPYSTDRDIFRYYATPTPTPLPTPVATPFIPPAPTPVPTPTGPPPPPPIEGFKVMALVKRGAERLAILKKDEEIYVGGKGTVLKVKEGSKASTSEGGSDSDKASEVRPGRPRTTEILIMDVAVDNVVLGYPGKDYRQVVKFEEPKETSSSSSTDSSETKSSDSKSRLRGRR